MQTWMRKEATRRDNSRLAFAEKLRYIMTDLVFR